MAVVRRTVEAPSSAVLEVLADGWTYSSWVVGAARIEGVDADWPAPGSRLAHSVGPWPLRIDDVTYSRGWQPDHGIVLQARGWPLGEARVVVTVEPLGPDRCRVTMEEDATNGPGLWVPGPLRNAVLRFRNIEALHRLAILAERPTPEEERGPDPT